MYGNKRTENSNSWINLIENAISERYIKYYKFEEFSKIQEIGVDACGKFYRAYRKNSNRYVTLKSFFNFNNVTVNEIINEVIANYFEILSLNHLNIDYDK